MKITTKSEFSHIVHNTAFLHSSSLTLDLDPPAPSGALGDKRSPLCSIGSMVAASFQERLTPLRSSLNVLHHVILGHPCFLLPCCGFQSMAIRRSLVGSSQRTCLANHTEGPRFALAGKSTSGDALPHWSPNIVM